MLFWVLCFFLCVNAILGFVFFLGVNAILGFRVILIWHIVMNRIEYMYMCFHY